MSQPRDDFMRRGLTFTIFTLSLMLVAAGAASAAAGDYYFLTNGTTGGQADVSFHYGRADDGLLVGDWDGDGVDTLAVRRGATYYINNNLGGGAAEHTFTFGSASDRPVAGDWNGNGRDSIALRRGRTFHIDNDLNGSTDQTVTYGREGDRILAGDWDGDGDDTFGVRRGRTYFLNNTLAGGEADATFAYGREGDQTHVGDWDGDGDDTLAVRRGNHFHLSNQLQGGSADIDFSYGRVSDVVLIGDWDDDGHDSPGLRREEARFGDGQHRVGPDVRHGLYRGQSSGAGCYWERNSSTGGGFDTIIANHFSTFDGPLIARIEPSDALFETDDCGTWTEIHLTDTPSPTTSPADGHWRVNIDVVAGTYTTSDTDGGCYWERLSDFTGESSGIIDNHFQDGGQTVVVIEQSDVGFYSDDCGTWTRQ